MARFDPKNVNQQVAIFAAVAVFVLVWAISEQFWIAVGVLLFGLLRVPGLWKALAGKATSDARYRPSRYDPFANEKSEAEQLETMPRYSEGRLDRTAMPVPAERPTRTYEPDEDEEDAVPVVAAPMRATTQFGSSAIPPKKPVQLPRYRP